MTALRRFITEYLSRMQTSESAPPRKPFSKIAWSWLGAFTGIYLVSLLNALIYSAADAVFLVGSFGASAVLLYGIPQSDYAQPRNLIGGHTLSALVGITVYTFIPMDAAFNSALAVSLAIVLMHFSRTLHPPGGATALIAVIGSAQIHQMGYFFVIVPILSGALILLLVALIVNNISSNPKRHYPRYWL